MSTSNNEYLLSKNIKPSYSRLRILDYLISKKNHPTVELIYKELVKEIPTLSKTTVYNTLNLFVEKGIAKVISIEENTARYDANTMDHGHFKCNICKEIFDFSIDIDNKNIIGLDDFKIDERDFYFKGICKKCKNKDDKKGE
jgi:Fur family peroxide stress response transcriptional regulator